jgi:predicted RNase H-like HicB family nuclease
VTAKILVAIDIAPLEFQRRMSRTEKLFDKLMSRQNDANFPFNDLCTLLAKVGYTARKTKGSHIIFQRGSSFLNLTAVSRRKSKGLSGTPGAPRVEKSESQTMLNKHMQPDPREYEIRIWYSAEKGDECFIAQVVEWPGIMAHGDTREEAARQIQLALEGALEVASEQGIKPPAPALAHAL